MHNLLVELYHSFKLFMDGEEGQNMGEYVLLALLLGLAAVASTRSVASAAADAFSNFSTYLLYQPGSI